MFCLCPLYTYCMLIPVVKYQFKPFPYEISLQYAREKYWQFRQVTEIKLTELFKSKQKHSHIMPETFSYRNYFYLILSITVMEFYYFRSAWSRYWHLPFDPCHKIWWKPWVSTAYKFELSFLTVMLVLWMIYTLKSSFNQISQYCVLNISILYFFSVSIV